MPVRKASSQTRIIGVADIAEMDRRYLDLMINKTAGDGFLGALQSKRADVWTCGSVLL
jgi:hypothetical protein